MMEQTISYSLILTKDQADYIAAGKYGPNRAPWLAPFSLLFNNRFCRVWLADAWHIVMSRKGTCIFTHFPFFVAEKGKPKRERLWNLPDLNRFRKPTHWSGKTSGLTGALPTSACWIHGKSPLCLDIGGY